MLNIINITFYYLINLFIKKISSLNIVLKYLLLRIINKKSNNIKVYLIIKKDFIFKI